MQAFRLVSKILRNRLLEPPPRASTNDHDPDEGIPLDTTQDDEEIATDTKNTTYLSARERLDKLSRFRTNSSAISINLSGGQSCGAYAPVFQATFKRARWSRKQKVAVKKLPFPRDTDSPMFANSFVHEAETMAGLSHENIVRFVAFVEDLEHEEAWIIMPWEPNGNINEFLRARKCEIPERISLIKDTFEGIQYLHTRQPPICHGALKSVG
ncbi:hypothetical protein M407DRAFT_19310 [Tulasnella calospora MUT 4182]|uniref:Protein kinase domain-containing protein n=1 Tax=Tulasnella calospora MUT 4182 TaxID=1051891 RepID=A0A0C3QSA8_9AGAM|nr:hypothetical protein M407DRAFT_19310 [Tulasnella calospora MUT 4182]